MKALVDRALLMCGSGVPQHVVIVPLCDFVVCGAFDVPEQLFKVYQVFIVWLLWRPVELVQRERNVN
eukprot:1093817-Amphidinium_carterae.1